MKVAIYVRVSTRDKQDIGMQVRNLEEYAEREKLEVFDMYRDIGHSGSKSTRPEWDRLLTDMRGGLFDILLIYKLDRIGRSIQNLVEIFREFDENKIKIIATTQNIDNETPEGKMFRNMLMVFSEYERELTIARIHDGLKNARKNGKTLGRPSGSKDKRSRRKLGYYQRWEKYRVKKGI